LLYDQYFITLTVTETIAPVTCQTKSIVCIIGITKVADLSAFSINFYVSIRTGYTVTVGIILSAARIAVRC
jgi:hypothetical protein